MLLIIVVNDVNFFMFVGKNVLSSYKFEGYIIVLNFMKC